MGYPEPLLTLANTDASAASIVLTVDSDPEELACLAEIGDHVFYREPGLNFNRSIGSVLWVQH